VLDAKGGENKAKARNGSATTWGFWKSRVRVFCLSKMLIVSYCQKLVSCGEKAWLWEKGGVFESLINFSWNIYLCVSTSVFDLEIGNWVWFAKTNQVVAKNDPYMQIWIKTVLSSHLYWCYTSFSCLLLCWHKSPKRGRLKGKCALGPFLSILVIECQHKWAYAKWWRKCKSSKKVCF
jgi:hypothetical protein